MHDVLSFLSEFFNLDHVRLNLENSKTRMNFFHEQKGSKSNCFVAGLLFIHVQGKLCQIVYF